MSKVSGRGCEEPQDTAPILEMEAMPPTPCQHRQWSSAASPYNQTDVIKTGQRGLLLTDFQERLTAEHLRLSYNAWEKEGNIDTINEGQDRGGRCHSAICYHLVQRKLSFEGISFNFAISRSLTSDYFSF